MCPKYLVANITHRSDKYRIADREAIKVKVREIEDLLYKFSLEKLQKFIERPFLMLLVLAYSKSSKFGFSLEKENMISHR